jgi:hypothetical protein
VSAALGMPVAAAAADHPYTNQIACCDRRAEIADLLRRTRVYKATRLSFPCDVSNE